MSRVGAWYTTLVAGIVLLGVAAERVWAAPTDFLGGAASESMDLTATGPAASAGEPPESTGGAAMETKSWREFFRQRTRWGVGAEERYLNNVFSTRGASRQDDLITTAETQVAFADPRGDWLYGGSYEMNSLHYHDLGEHPFTHEFRSYAHYTPLGRYRVALTEQYGITQRLATAATQADAIRRFATVTEARSNEMGLQGTYDLNATNAVRAAYTWGWDRDKAPDGANVNHDTHQFTVGMDHDVTRRLTVFGGYTVADTAYLKAPSKDVFGHGLALEARYDVDPSTIVQLLTTAVQRNPATGKSSIKANVKLIASRLLTPRTRWAVTVSQQTLSSVTASTSAFTSRMASWQLSHALTPRVSATWEAAYEHVATTTRRSDRVAAGLGFDWQMRPNVACTLGYHYQVLNQDNIASHVVTVGVEAQLW